MKPPDPIQIGNGSKKNMLPNEIEMPFIDHIEELRQRLLKSFWAVLVAAISSLIVVKPIVKFLEAPAGSIRFLQVAPGEFLVVSIKVACYTGITISIPFILFQGLAFVLPGLTTRERNLIAPAVAGSGILFIGGLLFAWWALVPAALSFLINYGADVVEPIWSIERYLDFVITLMLATGLAFQLPVLQLLLGILGLINTKAMISSWRWVLITTACASAVLTPSTDPITMLLLSVAISSLFIVGLGLVSLTEKFKEDILPTPPPNAEEG